MNVIVNLDIMGPECIDPCSNNPCHNEALCIKVNALLSGFKCQCVNNYTGKS